MEKINILLCCGSGMSSGYLATRTRKAAKKRNLLINIEATAQSNVGSSIANGSIDILLLGPHFASQLETMEKLATPHNVVVRLIPNEIYGMLDGDGLLDYVIEALKEANSKE